MQDATLLVKSVGSDLSTKTFEIHIPDDIMRMITNGPTQDTATLTGESTPPSHQQDPFLEEYYDSHHPSTGTSIIHDSQCTDTCSFDSQSGHCTRHGRGF